MVKHQRGAVTAVMNMSLFVLLLLLGLLCSASGLPRKYHYISKYMTWTDAQSYCRATYTDLATADSMDDVNMMIKTVDSGYIGSVWIGLQRATQSQWVWSNGDDTLKQYNNWGDKNPSGTNPYAFFANGYWYNFVPWSDRMLFACYNESIGNIKIIQWDSWRGAQSYCRQYYTDLAIIRSAAENDQLYADFGNGPWVWFGLFLDSWQWSDQWNRFFRYWADGYPTQFGDCAAFSTSDSGKWVHYSCDQLHQFICYEDMTLRERQMIRLKLSCDGKCNMNDPSLQSATMNESEDLQLHANSMTNSTKLHGMSLHFDKLFVDGKMLTYDTESESVVQIGMKDEGPSETIVRGVILPDKSGIPAFPT
nr:secretory phospholipase A2 receptor-like [Misgurnus anguillicaudatus]